jgi:hypothetical protein
LQLPLDLAAEMPIDEDMRAETVIIQIPENF